MVLPEIHGIGRSIWNLLQQFSQNKTVFSFMVLHNDKKVEPILKEFGFPIIWVKSHIFSLFEQIEIPFVLKKEAPDLFHSPSIFVPFFSSCPIVVTIHDLIPFILKSNKSFFIDCYLYFLRNACRNKIKKIIVPSESTRLDMEHIMGTEQKKACIIPLGVEEKFKVVKKNEEKEKICKKYGIPGSFIFTLISSNPHKNLKGLLNTFSIFSRRNEFCLVVGGNINAEKQVQAMGLEKQVIFLGYVPEEDLPCLYQSASLFVFPSLYEGFGLPVLEAMAAGLPIISSNKSSLSELINEAGILVEPNNAKAFALEIERVLSDKDLYEKLGQKSKERAACFTWEKAAKETINVYKEALYE